MVIRATIEGHGSEADVTVTVPPLPTGTIRIVSGDGQQARVTDTVPEPLVVQVLDQNGAPRPGVVATFLAAADTAELTSNFVTTDADGFASTVVVLKTKAGPFTVAVSAAGQWGAALSSRSIRTAPGSCSSPGPRTTSPPGGPEPV